MSLVYDQIHNIRGNIITTKATGVALGELARLEKHNGQIVYGTVLRIEDENVHIQLLENPRGVMVDDKITFLGREMEAKFSHDILGRRFNGAFEPIDGGPQVRGKATQIAGPSANPMMRIMPHSLVRTNVPMIDVFNCLVKSQKIPIFSTAGEPYNELLMRIANQTDASKVIIGGMGLTFDAYQAFIDNAAASGKQDRTTMFIHQATDPVVECVLVPDQALACAEQFALEGEDVLVLLTDMTAFADALKEIAITMDQIPSNRGYPGSLYSDLASRYEKAIEMKGTEGSVTLLTVTTMPGNDVTHPVSDNTGYITEGQFYLNDGWIEPFGSLSRLKQQVIGKKTREDHGDVANGLINLYAKSKKARERQSMGFKLSSWDQKLLRFSHLFEDKMMRLDVNLSLEDALDLGWKMLAECFDPDETGIKRAMIEKRWPKEG